MKTNMKMILVVLALGASALAASAQDNNQPWNDGPNRPQGGPGGPGMNGHRPPPPAIIGAIDANHDGVIDADEIANASAALKALDKNGDGKLTPDEFVGHPPKRPGNHGDQAGGKDAGGPPDDMPPGPPPGDQ